LFTFRFNEEDIQFFLFQGWLWYVMDKIYYQNSDNTWTTYSGSTGWAQLQAAHPSVNPTANTILVTYAPSNQAANFTHQWANNTPGYNTNSGVLQGSLPANATTTGMTGAMIPVQNPVVPMGYKMGAVTAPDGKVYTSFTVSNNQNVYTITLTASDGTTKQTSSTVNPAHLLAAVQASFPTYGLSNNFGTVVTALQNNVYWQTYYTTSGSGSTSQTLQNSTLDALGSTLRLTGSPLYDLTPTISSASLYISGYQFDASNSLPVVGDPGTTIYPTFNGLSTASGNLIKASYNRITVRVTPYQSGTVSYQYVAGTPGTDVNGQPSFNPSTPGKAAPLPANVSLGQNKVGDKVVVPSTTVPSGYAIDHVSAPDGQSYSTIADAQVAGGGNATYLETPNPAQGHDWQIYLKALVQNPTVMAKFVDAGAGISTPSSFTLPFQDDSGNAFTALTGAVIPSAVIASTENALQVKVTGAAYKNWYLTRYMDPNGNYDQNSTTASLNNTVALAGGNVLGSSNQYTAQYEYGGTLSYISPSKIDFGNHINTGDSQTLTGQLRDSSNNPQAVVVTDERKQPTSGNLSWTLTVAQSKPITSSIFGLSFGDTLLSFNGTAMTLNSPLTVSSDSQSSTGKITTVLPDNSNAFKLLAPGPLQVPGANYQGELTWTMVSAP
jgi:hypothetical protein